MTDFARELSVTVDLARKAGASIMEVYATDFSVAYKGKNDPVTDADKRGNELIVKGLQQAFPDDIIVAEESEEPDDTQTGNRIWYVDPVDGTKEFIAKNGEFSVMIGLAVNGRAHLGVVYRPDGDVLYAGVVDQEAWMERNGQRTPLVIDPPDASASITLAVSRSHRNPLLEKIGHDLGVGNEIPSGSVGLKIGLIVRGLADVYMEPGPYTKLWDACGPEAILKAAGGQFTNILGQPLRYGLTQLKNTHGLVATPIPWRVFLRGLGLPEELTPDGALEVLAGAERAQVQLSEWRAVTQELHQVEAQAEEIVERLNNVLAQCGEAPVSLVESSTALSALRKALEESVSANNDCERLSQVLREKRPEWESAESEKMRYLEQLSSLLEAGGARDPETFRRRAVHYTRQAELERQQRQLEVALRVHAGSAERHKEMEHVLSMKNRAELERELADITRDGQQRIGDILTKHLQEKGRVEQQLQDLEHNDRLTSAMLEHQMLLAQLDMQTQRWAVKAIVQHLLEKARQIYERERQPAVLREASKFFQVMTEGKYVRIMVPLGEMRLEITPQQHLEHNDRLTSAMLEHQMLLAQLDMQTQRWAVKAIVQHLLEKARQIYERERQPAVLREASKFFQVMTEGKYVRIMVPLGEMRLEITPQQGMSRTTDVLSRGTAEQLYLSMRLAFVREYAKHAGPLPLVVDDIFVNFDPGRAQAAMKILGEIAQTHQVLVFTCHPHVTQWFQETLPGVPIRPIPKSA